MFFIRMLRSRYIEIGGYSGSFFSDLEVSFQIFDNALKESAQNSDVAPLRNLLSELSERPISPLSKSCVARHLIKSMITKQYFPPIVAILYIMYGGDKRQVVDFFSEIPLKDIADTAVFNDRFAISIDIIRGELKSGNIRAVGKVLNSASEQAVLPHRDYEFILSEDARFDLTLKERNTETPLIFKEVHFCSISLEKMQQFWRSPTSGRSDLRLDTAAALNCIIGDESLAERAKRLWLDELRTTNGRSRKTHKQMGKQHGFSERTSQIGKAAAKHQLVHDAANADSLRKMRTTRNRPVEQSCGSHSADSAEDEARNDTLNTSQADARPVLE